MKLRLSSKLDHWPSTPNRIVPNQLLKQNPELVPEASIGQPGAQTNQVDPPPIVGGDITTIVGGPHLGGTMEVQKEVHQ